MVRDMHHATAVLALILVDRSYKQLLTNIAGWWLGHPSEKY